MKKLYALWPLAVAVFIVLVSRELRLAGYVPLWFTGPLSAIAGFCGGFWSLRNFSRSAELDAQIAAHGRKK